MCVFQLVQAAAGKFNLKVHVEYEWNLRLEELDESDDELDDKVTHSPLNLSCNTQPFWTHRLNDFLIVFIPSPVLLRRIVLPGRRVSVTHTVCLLMTSSLCLVLASVISSASHTLHSPIRCTAFLPTVHPLQSQMPHLCLLGMQAKVTQKPKIQSNV